MRTSLFPLALVVVLASCDEPDAPPPAETPEPEPTTEQEPVTAAEEGSLPFESIVLDGPEPCAITLIRHSRAARPGDDGPFVPGEREPIEEAAETFEGWTWESEQAPPTMLREQAVTLLEAEEAQDSPIAESAGEGSTLRLAEPALDLRFDEDERVVLAAHEVEGLTESVRLEWSYAYECEEPEPRNPPRQRQPPIASLMAGMGAIGRCERGAADFDECVIRTLEGRARSTSQVIELISAYQRTGNMGAAYRHMQSFVRRYPTHPRTEGYRSALPAGLR